MISKNGIRAFSDERYDYYRLTQTLGGIVPKGAIFVHDTDDAENGSIAEGCLKLCWTPDGNIYTVSPSFREHHVAEGLCGNTVVFHALFKESSLFELAQSKVSDKQKRLQLIIKDLKNQLENAENKLRIL